MSILKDINKTLSKLNYPFQTGEFKDKVPNEYIVIVPMIETFDYHADNKPQINVEEVRLSLFSKCNYTAMKNKIIKLLIDEDYTITNRQYIGYESDTGYYHYNIDVEKYYEMEE